MGVINTLMAFEAMRLDDTPPRKHRANRDPELSLELLPCKKSGRRGASRRGWERRLVREGARSKWGP